MVISLRNFNSLNKIVQNYTNVYRTELDANKRTAPTGINAIPTIKKAVMTGTGVKIGCHAFSCCCLKAVTN
jgi:hypothetical protein